jgi:hypothetical protein
MGENELPRRKRTGYQVGIFAPRGGELTRSDSKNSQSAQGWLF